MLIWMLKENQVPQELNRSSETIRGEMLLTISSPVDLKEFNETEALVI